MAARAAGVETDELLEILVLLALERHDRTLGGAK
jgi:hypothetical protein